MKCPHCGDGHRADQCPRPAILDAGTRLDEKYMVIRHISSGGMGAVYEVEHTLIGKRLAAKLLLPELARRRELLERFRREARAASAIGHEHIIEVTDLGETATGAPFIVMELLKGRTLGDELARLGRLGPQRAVHIARQMLRGLGAAHERGIIHRDLKPDNIFLSPRQDNPDFVKLLDFGISKFLHVPDGGDVVPGDERELTAVGAVVGTPTYMAPEQARGDRRIDHRADLYAVGAILYRMLTGSRPYVAPSWNALVFAIAQGELVRPRERVPEIPSLVEAAVLRAMAVEPGARFSSARDFADALGEEDPTREWMGRGVELPAGSDGSGPAWAQASATMNGVPPAPPPPPARAPWTIVLASVLAALTIATGGFLFFHRQGGRHRVPAIPRGADELETAALPSEVASPSPGGATSTGRAPVPAAAPTMIHLDFALEPKDARGVKLTLDGAAVSELGLEMARDGARHVLRAEASGYSPVEIPFFASNDQELAVRWKKRGAQPQRSGVRRPHSIDDAPAADDPSVKTLLNLVNGMKDGL